MARKKPKTNAEWQQAYRQRHHDDLIKARRVATALMTLRSSQGWGWRGTPIQRVAEALRSFLTDDELKDLIAELRKRRRGG